ncbi:MAG: type II secretion system minor pseudopilin GspK, partial [Halofilum sp. (in: g-proteobacteria)]
MRGAQRQQGVALITVLLVIALATVAAVQMTRDGVYDRRRSGNLLALEQAHQVALGGERWAVAMLADQAERERDRQGADDAGRGLEEKRIEWPQAMPPIPIEGGQVGGEIADAQARFNLNSLVGPGGVDALAVSRFQRLLSALGLERTIAMATVDWIDRDSQVTHPGGGEANFYLSLAEPYRIANRPMATASELRRVRGVDAATWRALAPHVTALPRATPVNVNTAGPQVIRALVPTADTDAAETLAETSFDELGDFLRHPLVENGGVSVSGLAVRSEYYRSRVDVEFGPMSYTLYSWLQQENDGRLRVL